MKKCFSLILLFLTIISTTIYSASSIKKIQGSIKDESGNPLPSVNVYILETSEGTMTNQSGDFTLSTNSSEIVTLIASIIGFRKFDKKIDLSLISGSVDIQIRLIPESIQLEEAVVLGSSFSSESSKGLIVSAIDVMTTPGGAADLYQSLKTMPGLTQVSESAELYVRGGDPTETVTLIDQAAIYHPYTYESAYGGLFSNLNTSAVREMFFSSGGFSAKYGNVLSGVLDIQTKDIPLESGYALGLSMAASSLDAEIPLVDNKLGIRLYGQESYTKPIMWLNNSLDNFTVQPRSRNLTGSISYKISETGIIKLTSILAEDIQGVNVDRAEFDGVFNGNSQTQFYNLQLSELLGKNTRVKSSLSLNSYQNNWELGILDLNKNDQNIKTRTDFEHIFTKEIQFSFGFEIESRTEKYSGIIPNQEYDYRKDADHSSINVSLNENRYGAYAEIKKLNIFGIDELYTIVGFRTDYFEKLDLENFDLRYGIGYNLSNKSKVRASLGTFHQVPDYRLFGRIDGSSDLKSMKAAHYVVSLDHEFIHGKMFRLEIFHKDYSSLPLKDIQKAYNNDGYGYASGLDIIFKGDLPFKIDGWISYSYIDTKRKWLDYEKSYRSNFDITHNLSIVLKYNFSAMWQIGANFKYASGKPFTPVIGSTFDQTNNISVPIYGEDNSAVYPDYKRVDLRLTHMNSLSKNIFTIFYLEGINIFDIDNLFGFTHNEDYSVRQNVKSYFGRRTLVLGAMISL